MHSYSVSAALASTATPSREPLHTVDPKGDVILILHNPDAPFAVWNENNNLPYVAPLEQSEADPRTPYFDPSSDDSEAASTLNDDLTQDPITHFEPDPELVIPDTDTAVGNDDKVLPELHKLPPSTSSAQATTEVRFLLSSRHLILASEYFRSALEGPWKEGNSISPDGHRSICAEDWDGTALLILMQVIHGRCYSVPRLMSLEMLAKIAVLVDYYQCHEVIKIWSDIWIEKLACSIPKTCTRELLLWILIAFVFEQKDLFAEATKVAIEYSLGPLPTSGLPIGQVVGK
ncbi:hypothetical protein CHU98_g11841 [Xylaria longipes]|nr:hypothetical protein CHU98_g11841 [Xylaria longipes]